MPVSRHFATAAGLAGVAAGTFWVAAATRQPLSAVASVAVLSALMCLPLGGLVTRVLVPGALSPLIRLALGGGVGFMLTAPLVSWLGGRGILGWYLPLCLLLLVAWAVVEWRAPDSSSPATRDGVVGTASGRPFPVGAALTWVVVLSVVVITPLMTPFREVAPGSFVTFAYADDFYHLALVQSLTRTLPLADWPSLSGTRPEFYTLYHHIVLATIARLAAISAMDMVTVYGRILGVVLTAGLSYAVGAVVTRSTWGGLVAAALQHLVLVPNIYDRNLLLAGRQMPFLPNFYQLHFYGLRYAAHSVSGDVVTLVACLCVMIALRAVDDRTRVGALSLAGAAACILLQVRGQFALAVLPATGLVQLAVLARERRARYLLPPVLLAGLVGLSIVSLSAPGSRSDLVFDYGVFGAWAVRKGFLPTVVRQGIALLPTVLQPGLGVSAILLLRMVGLNGLVLIGWSLLAMPGRAQIRREQAYLLTIATSAWLLAMFVEQRTIPANLGMNFLTATRMPLLLLMVPPLLQGGRWLLTKWPWPTRHPLSATVVLLAVLTAVSSRGASAALFDQRDRAYRVSEGELASFRWIEQNSDAAAVVAALPEHVVNDRGEQFRSSNLLSALTARPVYVQRITSSTAVEGERRAALFRRFYTDPSGERACGLARGERFDYVLEWAAEPMPPRPCLRPVFNGDPRVYEMQR